MLAKESKELACTASDAYVAANLDVMVDEYETKANEIAAFVESLDVSDGATLETATQTVNQIKEIKSVMEKLRKEHNEPHQAIIKHANDACKPVREILEECDTGLRRKMRDYLAERQRKRDEYERQLTEEAAQKVQEAETMKDLGMGESAVASAEQDASDAESQIETLPEYAATRRYGHGESVGLNTHVHVKLLNVKQVELGYWKPDVLDTALRRLEIKRDFRAGKRDFPGLVVEERQHTAVRKARKRGDDESGTEKRDN